MKQYLDLLNTITKHGRPTLDRTGVGTHSIHGHQMRFDLKDRFPVVTTKKIHMKSVIHELLWMLSGDTNVKNLQKHGVSIWDEWADADGELGPIYGHQWRKWETFTKDATGQYQKNHIDQITQVVQTLINNPSSRRIIVSAWNVADIEQMKLPPCHMLFQFFTFKATTAERQLFFAKKHNKDISYAYNMTDAALDAQGIPIYILDSLLYQRSCDTFLGVPFNISFYALLTIVMAQVTNMIPNEFIWTGGDVHIYTNHREKVVLQLTREPRKLPKMIINPEVKNIFDFKYEDFTLSEYDPHPAIKASVAV